MSLYPSLEDMQVDQMARAQMAQVQHHSHPQPHPDMATAPPPYAGASAPPYYPPSPDHRAAEHMDAKQAAMLYPSLQEYMGLEFTPEMLAQLAPENATPYPEPCATNSVAIPQPNQVVLPQTRTGLLAPLSSNSVGLRRAEVTHGIREVVLCKDGKGKVGMRVKDVSKGVFVALVTKNSPAALAGLRFGDQILNIDGENVAGYNVSKVHGMFKRAGANNIRLAVRDRPFERTITLHKDSVGHIGFGFKNGKINMIVKDSSAARNGLLIDHHLLEVNGQNVVGLKDKETSAIVDQSGNIITVTIMPTFLYEHMLKNMRSSLVKDLMDHSIPDL